LGKGTIFWLQRRKCHNLYEWVIVIEALRKRVTEMLETNKIQSSESNKTLGTKILHGSMLQFFGRFFFRSFKFLRMIILAKLLFPEDIGLFALAGLCLGFADIFVQTGFQSALIEKDNLTRKHLDSVWTIHICKGLFLGSFTMLLAPYLSLFFNEPSLTPVLRVLACTLVLDGFVNIGVILMQKELQFGRKLLFDATYILTDIIAVIVLAFFIPNVWALVIGTLCGQIASVVFSYILHPYRPRLTLDWSEARELFEFGKWVSIASILTFIASRADAIAIGKLINIEALGYYQLAFSLAMLPGLEIVRSLGVVFFPFFTKLKHTPIALRDAFVRISRMLLFIVTPTTIGLYIVSEGVVLNIYGDRWVPSVPLLHLLVVYGGLKSVEYFLTPLVLGAGKPKLLTQATFLHGLILCTLLVPLVSQYGTRGAALSLVLAASCSTIYLCVRLPEVVKLTVSSVFSIIFVPVLSGVLMYLGVVYIKLHFTHSLGVLIICGIILYAGSAFICDYASGNKIRVSFVWMLQNLRKTRV
jgi:O-antigen/teichoic acid export membrane protein